MQNYLSTIEKGFTKSNEVFLVSLLRAKFQFTCIYLIIES